MRRFSILLVLCALAACEAKPTAPPSARAPGAPDQPTAPAVAPSASAASSTTAAQEPIGVNTQVVNAVTTHTVGETAWRPSQPQGQVRFLDDITTGSASRLDVTLRDRSVLNIGADARLTMDRFVYDPAPGAAGVGVSVVKGVFRFASGGPHSGQDGESFRTPTAAIGVRGTLFDAAVGAVVPQMLGDWAGGLRVADDPAGAALVVLREGIIEVRTEERTVTLRVAGQAVVVSGKHVSDPFYLPARKARLLLDRLPPLGGVAGGPPPTDPKGPGRPRLVAPSPIPEGPAYQGPQVLPQDPPASPVRTRPQRPTRDPALDSGVNQPSQPLPPGEVRTNPALVPPRASSGPAPRPTQSPASRPATSTPQAAPDAAPPVAATPKKPSAVQTAAGQALSNVLSGRGVQLGPLTLGGRSGKTGKTTPSTAKQSPPTRKPDPNAKPPG